MPPGASGLSACGACGPIGPGALVGFWLMGTSACAGAGAALGGAAGDDVSDMMRSFGNF